MLRLYNSVDLSSVLAFSHSRKQCLLLTHTEAYWVKRMQQNNNVKLVTGFSSLSLYKYHSNLFPPFDFFNLASWEGKQLMRTIQLFRR